jgi:NTE family protein
MAEEDNIELQIKELQNKLKEIKKTDKKLKNLVFSGGSTKGFSYVGVIKCLDEFSLLDNLEEIAGTSIGALFSVFVCLKFHHEDLLNIFTELDLNWLHSINSDSVLHLINKYGLDNGDIMLKIIELFLAIRFPTKQASEVTFLDLWNYNPIKITMFGSKVYQGVIEPQIYNHETTPKMSISKALRISMSIPPIFSPINEESYHLVDGGIINNYPIELFKDKLDVTLGILCSEKNNNEKCKNIIELYKSIIVFMMTKETFIKKNKYIDNTVLIESSLNMFNIFNISIEDKENIINLGYQLTKQFLLLKGYSIKKLDNYYENNDKNEKKDKNDKNDKEIKEQNKYNHVKNRINTIELINNIKLINEKIKKPSQSVT